jgi:long-chain acyl-CoA synthetase
VVAFVELSPGRTVTAEALAQYAATELAAYKRPAEIIILPALPASATGKILKSQLRTLAVRRAEAAAAAPVSEHR